MVDFSVLPGTLTVDLHGKNCYQAKIAIDAALRRAGRGVYRLRLIHGHHGGEVLKNMIAAEYSNHSNVLRMVCISNGTTDLVLREM